MAIVAEQGEVSIYIMIHEYVVVILTMLKRKHTTTVVRYFHLFSISSLPEIVAECDNEIMLVPVPIVGHKQETPCQGRTQQSSCSES